MKGLLKFISILLLPCDWLGQRVMQHAYLLTKLTKLVYLSVRTAMVEQFHGARSRISVIAEQIYYTGWQAMPIIFPLALVTGAVVIMQSASQLNIIGGRENIGRLLVVVLIRELAPLLTALIVIARSGTAVATDIGNMRANYEVEALEAMGIHPYGFIVFPRIVGGMISMICLSFYFTIIALYGGYLVTTPFIDLNLTLYFSSLDEALHVRDYVLFIIKTLASGLFIFAISSFYGLNVKHSHHEVPIATTGAVMKCLSYVIFFNLGATFVFYLLEYLNR